MLDEPPDMTYEVVPSLVIEIGWFCCSCPVVGEVIVVVLIGAVLLPTCPVVARAVGVARTGVTPGKTVNVVAVVIISIVAIIAITCIFCYSHFG